MKSTPGTLILALAPVTVFGIEIDAQRMGDETALLAMGASTAMKILDLCVPRMR